MNELIEKLEKAEAGSRELDAEIAAALRIPPPGAAKWIKNWRGRYIAHTPPGRVKVQHSDGTTGVHWSAAYYTTSIDAALTLVPRTCVWKVYSDFPGDVFWAEVFDPRYEFSFSSCERSAPALAICIAALKARKEP